MPLYVTLNMKFAVEDAALLRSLAQEATEAECPEDYDPEDLGQCLYQVLLEYNPDIKGYLDYGVECQEVKTSQFLIETLRPLTKATDNNENHE